jgi:hypothetical protein
MELAWIKKDVNKMVVVPDWVNLMVDWGENKVMYFKLTKNDFAAVHLDKIWDAKCE